jgi:hypothetical protein
MKSKVLLTLIVLSSLIFAGQACNRGLYGADDKSKIHVGIVFDIGGKDDRSFNAAAFAGCKVSSGSLRREGDILDATLDQAIESRKRSGDLVVVEEPPAVYWKGTEIEIEWNDRPSMWKFIWRICRAAKRGRAIDHMDFGENLSKDYVSKTKSRLVNCDEFPDDLAVLIESDSCGTQRLNLPPERIHIFDFSVGESSRVR